MPVEPIRSAKTGMLANGFKRHLQFLHYQRGIRSTEAKTIAHRGRNARIVLPLCNERHTLGARIQVYNIN